MRRGHPDLQAYDLATRYFGVEPREILFVSSNGWDICGGTSFGFTTAWSNRSRAELEELGYTPDLEVATLDELAGKIELMA